MTIRDLIALARAPREEKAAQPEPVHGAELVVSTVESGVPILPVWTYDWMAKIAVTANSTVAAASDYWARNLSEPPIAVLDKPGGTPIEKHPLAVRFAYPNPFDTQDELWQQVVYELCASEKGAFIVAPLSNAGEPLALWAKSSDEVRIVPSTETFIGRYEIRVGPQAWEPVDPKAVAVIRFRLVHPTDKWGSWSPVSKVRREVRADTNMGRWIDYSLQNMGRTSSLVGVKDLTDQDVANKIRDYINANMMGASNSEKASVIAGDVTKVDFGAKFSDLDFGPLQDRIEVATARGFGLAPELLHILTTTTAGSGLGGERQSALDRQTYRNTLLPISKMLAAKVASVFAPVYDLDPECIVFDYSGVQALSEDRNEASSRLVKARGFIGLAEGRAWLGLPAKPEGDDYIPEERQRDAFISRVAPQPVKMQTKAIPAHDLLRKTIDAIATTHETKMEAAARKVFAKQRAATLNSLKADTGLETKADAYVPDGDWGDFSQLVLDAMADGASVHESALLGTFDIGSPKAAEAVMRRVTKIKGADDTTREAIRKAVSEARMNNATMADIAKSIEAVFDEAEGYRAAMIARTESIGAANEGGNVLAQDAVAQGIEVTKTWIAFQDERTRESHIMMDGQTMGIDEPFDNGLMFPGDPDGDAEEVINCRCSVGYEGAGPTPEEE